MIKKRLSKGTWKKIVKWMNRICVVPFIWSCPPRNINFVNMQNPIVHTRRAFLRRAVLGSALSCTVPSFLGATFQVLAADQQKGVQTDTGKDGKIFILL